MDVKSREGEHFAFAIRVECVCINSEYIIAISIVMPRRVFHFYKTVNFFTKDNHMAWEYSKYL